MSNTGLALRRFDPAPLLFGGVYMLLAVPILSQETVPASVLAASAVLGAALIALSIIDARTLRLPDALTLPLIAAGLLLTVALGWDDPLWRVAAAAAGFLVLYALAALYQAVRGRAGLGLGDAKLFAAAGAWLGLEGLAPVMLWASGIALLTIVIAAVLRRPIAAATRIPFGPFLALGFWLVWLYGPIA